MKKCPFCAEEIQDAAIKCRYCGSELAKVITHNTDNEPPGIQSAVQTKPPPLPTPPLQGNELSGIKGNAQSEIKKKTHPIAIAAILLVLAYLFYGAFTDKDKSVSPLQTTKTISRQPPTPEAQLPWILAVRSNCESYNSAPNEIKKSDIFNKNEAFLSTIKINSARGILENLETSRGGDSVSIAIKVGEFHFKTESLFDSIKRGSDLYKKLEGMAIGQCVIFSASNIESSSILEKSKVCNEEYFSKFLQIEACP